MPRMTVKAAGKSAQAKKADDRRPLKARPQPVEDFEASVRSVMQRTKAARARLAK